MKRKAVAVLLGGMMTLAMWGSSAQAMTYGYTTEDGKTGMITYYLSEDEQKKFSDWHKQEMREQVAYLEKYGISYDADKDVLLYQGKTVRWLIDEQIDNSCVAIQMPEGEIDVYTERAENYEVTGLRVATQEEYDERTREQEEVTTATETAQKAMDAVVFYAEEDGSVIHTFVNEDETVVDAGTASEGYTFVIEDEISDIEKENGTIYKIVTDDTPSSEGTVSSIEITENASASGNGYNEESKKKIREYREHGIDCNSASGSWMWNGKEVYMLMDENGSMYQNGSEEAKANKIYLLVKREEDGSIREVKQVTVEEVMAERIAADEAKGE